MQLYRPHSSTSEGDRACLHSLNASEMIGEASFHVDSSPAQLTALPTYILAYVRPAAPRQWHMTYINCARPTLSTRYHAQQCCGAAKLDGSFRWITDRESDRVNDRSITVRASDYKPIILYRLLLKPCSHCRKKALNNVPYNRVYLRNWFFYWVVAMMECWRIYY